MSKSMSLLSVLALLLFSVFADAQGLCNCSPVEYTFELKLDEITCPDPPLVDPAAVQTYFGPGVELYFCNPESGLPVKITMAQFAAFNERFAAISVETEEGLELENGDSLTFAPPTTNRVKAILLELRGEDENGQMVVNEWTIQFTNECGVLALQDGTNLGLVVFRDLRRPSQAMCPREDPEDPHGSFSYSTVSSKGGKGSKRSRYSNSKSGKIMSTSMSLNNSRRTLQAADSVSAELTGGGLSDEELDLRRLRRHV